jgi:hypothetical protein
MWCPTVAEVVVGSMGYVGVMVAVDRGYCSVVEAVAEECYYMVVARWVGVRRMLHLIEWRFLGLFLLTENVNGVLQFYEPCPLSIDGLPSGLNPLSSYLPSRDGFFLLVEPLNFLLHPTQVLLLYNGFVFVVLFIPVSQVHLIELSASFADLPRRRCPRG